MSALLLDAIPSLWRASDLERSAAPACPSGVAGPVARPAAPATGGPGRAAGLPALPVGAAPLGGPAAGLARAAAPGFACRACGCPGGAGAQTPWPAAGAVLAVACGPAFALACRSGGGAAPHTAPHTVTDHGGPVTQPFQAGSPCG